VLIGVDPSPAAQNNLPVMREKLRGKVCLWGGVDEAHVIELGSPDQVRQATERVIRELGPDGFILSPVDNVTVDTPNTWSNLQTMIETWRSYRGCHGS